MNELQFVHGKMAEAVANEFGCSPDKVELGDLELGTTWGSGQDYETRYQVDEKVGRVYWSTVHQETRVA